MTSYIRIVDVREGFEAQSVNRLVPRATVDVAKALAQVRPLIDDVAARGAQAIIDVTVARDGVNPWPLRVSAEELEQSLHQLDSDLREAIETSIQRVRQVSEGNLPTSTHVELAPGANVSQRWVPVESVGLYVPGGKAVYPSSVVMNVVPAQVAGVERLVIASPAQAAFAGRPHPTVLATAALLGVSEVYSMGGPAAIAAFAFGLKGLQGESVLEPVKMVTGPGNIYVTAAKRELRGRIGIDAEAGTTEILIIADNSADPRFIAYDLVSQAEHDEAAAAVLVTDSMDVAEAVARELSAVVTATRHRERVQIALGGIQSAIVVTGSLQDSIRFANEYATEHLEVHTVTPAEVLPLITNAGAVFLGTHSPVSLGDYMAGSSHVLPTGEAAKYSSGLGVHSFLRAQQVIDYSSGALEAVSGLVQTFADAEGLPAHGEAIRARFQ